MKFIALWNIREFYPLSLWLRTHSIHTITVNLSGKCSIAKMFIVLCFALLCFAPLRFGQCFLFQASALASCSCLFLCPCPCSDCWQQEMCMWMQTFNIHLVLFSVWIRRTSRHWTQSIEHVVFRMFERVIMFWKWNTQSIRGLHFSNCLSRALNFW